LCPGQTENTVDAVVNMENNAVRTDEHEQTGALRCDAGMGGSEMVEGETSNVIDKTVDPVMDDGASDECVSDGAIFKTPSSVTRKRNKMKKGDAKSKQLPETQVEAHKDNESTVVLLRSLMVILWTKGVSVVLTLLEKLGPFYKIQKT